jgi:hypothetical protein
MVAFLHAGLDKLLIASDVLLKHQPLQWVDPPRIDASIPLGEILPEPQRLAVVWPQENRQACTLTVAAPTSFLPTPNDQLKLRFWPTQEPRRGTVIFAPPWKLGSFHSLRPFVAGLNSLGFDVVGYPTPFHFERAPRGTFSGEFFATWDMPRTGWAIRAAALELCSLVESLQASGPVVMLGTSLGGYLSAMASVMAGRYPHRAFAPERLLLLVPPDSILDTFTQSPIGQRYRKLLVNNGGTLPDPALLESLAHPFSPGRFNSAVPGERILVMAARYDAVVPLVSSQRLASGFGARFLVYDAGHASALVFSPSVWRDAGRFLDEVGKAPQAQAPAQPSRSNG